MRTRNINLTEGSVGKGLFMFALPLMLSNFFQQLYNAVDSAVVGNYVGEEALAAVSSTGAVINLLIGFFLGMSTGTGVLYAMHYGAKDFSGLKKIIDCALILSAIAGAVMTVAAIIFAPQILGMMQTPDNVLSLAVTYLRVFLVGTVPILIYNVGAGMIRAGGDSKRPLCYLVIGGLVNLGLDFLFIAAFDWGVAGAAAATVIAQGVSAVLVVRHLMRFPSEYRLRPLHMRLSKVFMWDIARVSIPCGLQSSMFSFSNLIVQMKINTFGSVAMAGIGVYNKIDGFLYMPVMALSLAISTYVAQNIGAGRLDRIGKGVRFCLVCGIAVMVCMGLVVMLFIEGLAGIFSEEAEVVNFAVSMMWYMAPVEWVFCFSEIFGGAIRGSGHPMKVTVISAICICVFRVVWLVFVLPAFGTIETVFILYPISWVLSSAVMTLYYFIGHPHRKSIKDSRQAVAAAKQST